MAQSITITDYAVVTGKTTDTALAMALAINPVTAVFSSNINCQLQTNFLPDTPLAESLTHRVLLLLTKLWPSIGQAIADNEVYLLLPEFSGVDNPELAQLLQAIMRQFPSLLRSEHCKVFPYGSAATLMAFAAASAKLINKTSSKIWLLAVDSLAVENRLTRWCLAQGNRPQAVASEGAIALCLMANSTGLVTELHAADAQVSTNAQRPNNEQAYIENQSETALANLFLHIASQWPQPLAYIMLADTGDERLTATWLHQYHHLHGAVDIDTQFEFPGYFTGELGAAGGLYRLLSMYQGFEQQRLTAPLLQCEIAELSYRAVSVFSYKYR